VTNRVGAKSHVRNRLGTSPKSLGVNSLVWRGDDDDDDDDDEDDDDVATGIRSVSNDSCRRVAAGVARQSVPYH
jgi:hypothetical protein